MIISIMANTEAILSTQLFNIIQQLIIKLELTLGGISHAAFLTFLDMFMMIRLIV